MSIRTGIKYDVAFDDEMHELFGIDDDERRQTLYHFTIGGPVDDARLSTLPP